MKKESKSNNCEVDPNFKFGKPHFGNGGYFYIPSENEILVYNAKGKDLIGQLSGHESKIVKIVTNSDEGKNGLISCDEKGIVCYWEIRSSISKSKLVNSVVLPVKNASTVTYFNVISKYLIGGVSERNKKDSNLFLFKPSSANLKEQFITDGVVSGCNMVDISYNERFIGAVLRNVIFVVDLSSGFGPNLQMRYHRVGTHQATCLQFHPSKVIMAVGNQLGAITLWMNILHKYPVKMILHWHTLPVRDIAFSPQGNLYSGGGECMLVNWQLNDDNKKSFLPRLGAPINWITSDSTGQLLCLVHSDQSITIITAQEMKIEGVIKTLSVHLPQNPLQTLSIGLLFHKPTASLVKNGPTGHLQFFDPFTENLTYNLDVSMCNFVSNERNQVLPNAEITNGAISPDGSWLVTVEVCLLTPEITEITLKFWYYSRQDQRWELNTSIQQPHSHDINKLCCSPVENSSDIVFATCSEDGSFKIWNLVLYKDVSGSHRNYWSQYLSREFRGFPCSAGAFSKDGSLFAASFDSCVTLWAATEFTFIGSLSQSYLEQKILDLSFSTGDNCYPMLLSRSEDFICSWDILSCSLSWRVFLPSTCFIIHPLWDLIVVFSKRFEVFCFSSLSNQSLYNSTGSSKSKVLCATFIASNDSSENKNKYGKIFLFNEAQAFLTLDLPEKLKPAESNDANTQQLMLSKKEHLETPVLPDLSSALIPRNCKSFESQKLNRKLLKKSNTVPVNNILTELRKTNVHNVTFDAYLDSLSNFLPNINRERVNGQNSTKTKIDYNIDERSSLDDCRLVDVELDENLFAQIDYETILSSCLS